MCFSENNQPQCCLYLNTGNILFQVFKFHFSFCVLVMLEATVFIQSMLLKLSPGGEIAG